MNLNSLSAKLLNELGLKPVIDDVHSRMLDEFTLGSYQTNKTISSHKNQTQLYNFRYAQLDRYENQRAAENAFGRFIYCDHKIAYLFLFKFREATKRS
jgi:hypothetical protein